MGIRSQKATAPRSGTRWNLILRNCRPCSALPTCLRHLQLAFRVHSRVSTHCRSWTVKGMRAIRRRAWHVVVVMLGTNDVISRQCDAIAPECLPEFLAPPGDPCRHGAQTNTSSAHSPYEVSLLSLVPCEQPRSRVARPTHLAGCAATTPGKYRDPHAGLHHRTTPSKCHSGHALPAHLNTCRRESAW